MIIVGPGRKYLSGIAYYTWRLSQELNATPILFRDMLPRFLFPGADRVDRVDTRIQYTDATYLDWYNPVTWMKAIRKIRESDIFIIQWWTASVAHMLLFLTLLSGRKYIVETHEILDPMEHENPFLNAYSRLVKRILFNRASAIVVHTNEKGPKVITIPLAVFDHYRKYNRVSGTFTVLFFGLIRKYKGVDTLIKAFDDLDNPDKELFIIGENWDNIPIPIRHNIHYINRYVPDDDVDFYFSQADVLVLPYTRSSSSGVAAIAIHYGIPIIASDIDGLREQLYDYEGVFWVTPEDTTQIVKHLETIASKPGIRYPVPHRLSWDSVRAKWMILCESLKES